MPRQQLDRTTMQRFTSAVKQRNQNFLDAIALINARGTVTALDLQAHLEFKSLGAPRLMLRQLAEQGVVEPKHRDPNKSKYAPGLARYGLTAEALELDLHAMFPTSAHQVEIIGTAYSNSKTEVRHMDEDEKWVRLRTPTKVDVRRDPLVAFIHGQGRAPSLNFRSQLQGG